MKLDAEAKINSEARSCTGSLAIHPRARDIKIANFSITFYGTELLQDTLLELNCGRRYGLIGLNGSGKHFLSRFMSDSICICVLFAAKTLFSHVNIRLTHAYMLLRNNLYIDVYAYIPIHFIDF